MIRIQSEFNIPQIVEQPAPVVSLPIALPFYHNSVVIDEYDIEEIVSNSENDGEDDERSESEFDENAIDEQLLLGPYFSDNNHNHQRHSMDNKSFKNSRDFGSN